MGLEKMGWKKAVYFFVTLEIHDIHVGDALGRFFK